jgi:hypothetical protein
MRGYTEVYSWDTLFGEIHPVHVVPALAFQGTFHYFQGTFEHFQGMFDDFL